MSTTETSAARDTAHTALIALEYAESKIMPRGDGHSRLYVAIEAVRESVSFVSFPTETGRTRLRLRFEDVQRTETVGDQLNNLPPDGLIARGLSLSIHIAQTALAGCPANAHHALVEARLIVKLANQIGADRA